MVQEVVVVLIGIVVALIVLRKIYSFFFSKNQQKGSCGCSSCGCNTVKKIK